MGDRLRVGFLARDPRHEIRMERASSIRESECEILWCKEIPLQWAENGDSRRVMSKVILFAIALLALPVALVAFVRSGRRIPVPAPVPADASAWRTLT